MTDLDALAKLGDSFRTSIPSAPPVGRSRDLTRVLDLGRVSPWGDPELEDSLSKGGMALRPLQLEALTSTRDNRGLLGLLPVGCGKTLIGALAPTALGAHKAVYFTRSGGLDSTNLSRSVGCW